MGRWGRGETVERGVQGFRDIAGGHFHIVADDRDGPRSLARLLIGIGGIPLPLGSLPRQRGLGSSLRPMCSPPASPPPRHDSLQLSCPASNHDSPSALEIRLEP